MRIRSSSKAVALLLLVSFQYSFAIVDVALCSKALCYPKTSGAKYGAVSKKCPDGFELGQDAAGKAVCSKRVAKPCPDGTTLKDGKCCGATGSSKQCVPMPGYTSFSCPAGFTAMKDCDSTGATAAAAAGDAMPQMAEADMGRKLLTDNPLLKEVNIVGTRIIPNVILPKPAISFNLPPLKQKEPPKFNIPGLQIPQIILPEPAVSINVPPLPKVTPKIQIDGHPSFLPNIIPILPEPKITIDTQIGAMPKPFPTINTNISTKVVTVDLSNVGPSHTAEVNLPSFPDLKSELFKIPDIDVKLPQMPKVIDLSALGPKKSVNLTLPAVKLPSAGSLTIKNEGANEPQFLDLSGIMGKVLHKKDDGASTDKNFNIVLPKVQTEGATLNVVLDNKDFMKDITLPGPGGKHNTVINVPGWDNKEMPSKNAKLTIDVSANTNGLMQKVDQLNALAKDKKVENVNIALPDIDLSKIHKPMPDVVVDVKPLLSFNHSGLDLLTADQVKAGGLAGIGKGGNTRVNVTMKDIVIPKMAKDTTVVIKPKEFDLTKFLPKALLNKTDDGSIETTTTINLPEHSLPVLPVPKGKTDIDVSVPLKVGGLLKQLNTGKGPDATVNVKYSEEWTGGNATLPNPGSKVATFIGKAVNAVTAAGCPTKCCKEVELAGGCQDQEFDVETAPVQYECDAGCTYDLKNDKCLCSPGAVAECPAGLSKCSIAGKGVCAPSVEGLLGLDLCAAFKSVCGKVGVVAKTCL